VRISKQGRITSIFDIGLDREVVQDGGKTCGFVLFEDKPLAWDAWDVSIFHTETKSEINSTSISILEDGPLRASIIAKYHLGNSTIEAVFSLDAFASSMDPAALTMIRMSTKVDWHERHKFLKFEVNVAIDAETATFDNQFG
jgi:alpha-mannosidase